MCHHPHALRQILHNYHTSVHACADTKRLWSKYGSLSRCVHACSTPCGRYRCASGCNTANHRCAPTLEPEWVPRWFQRSPFSWNDQLTNTLCPRLFHLNQCALVTKHRSTAQGGILGSGSSLQPLVLRVFCLHFCTLSPPSPSRQTSLSLGSGAAHCCSYEGRSMLASASCLDSRSGQVWTVWTAARLEQMHLSDC